MTETGYAVAILYGVRAHVTRQVALFGDVALGYSTSDTRTSFGLGNSAIGVALYLR